MQVHEFGPPNAIGHCRCIHCGGLKVSGEMTATCLVRGAAPAREPRGVSAVYDVDVIHARIVELEAQTKAGLSVTEETAK